MSMSMGNPGDPNGGGYKELGPLGPHNIYGGPQGPLGEPQRRALSDQPPHGQWREFSVEARAPTAQEEYRRGLGTSFVDFITSDIERKANSHIPWLPSIDQFWTTAQVIINPNQLATVVRMWEDPAKRKSKSLSDYDLLPHATYSLTHFTPNPTGDYDKYFHPSEDKFGLAFRVEHAPFRPAVHLLIREIEYRQPKGTISEPLELSYTQRSSDQTHGLVLKAPLYKPTLTYSISNPGESATASVEYSFWSDSPHPDSIHVLATAHAFQFVPPYLRAEGDDSIQGHELKRLLAGEPIDDKWEYDKTTGLFRFHLTSKEMPPNNPINPWYVEFTLGNFNTKDIEQEIEQLSNQSGNLVDRLLNSENRFPLVRPFDQGVYIGAGYDRPSNRTAFLMPPE